MVGAREILERARSEDLRLLVETVDGEAIDEGPAELALSEPLGPTELEALEARVGTLPPDVRDLLESTRGFSVGAYDIRFDREDTYLLVEPLVPRHLVLGDDGAGNAWIVETGGKRGWGPVWFACHDPPSLVLQAKDLAPFVQEVLNEHRPAATRRLVTEGVLREPEDLPRVTAIQAGRLRDALADAPRRTRVFDARERAPGEGFPLGAAGLRARRLEGHAAFALDRGGLARTLARNLLGWAGMCAFFRLASDDLEGALLGGTIVFAAVRGYVALLHWRRAERPPGSCVVLILGWAGCCAAALNLGSAGVWSALGTGTLGFVILLVVAALLRR